MRLSELLKSRLQLLADLCTSSSWLNTLMTLILCGCGGELAGPGTLGFGVLPGFFRGLSSFLE
jgi:hypothetical protein